MNTTDMIKMVRAIESVLDTARGTYGKDKAVVFCEALSRWGLTISYDPALDRNGFDDAVESPRAA